MIIFLTFLFIALLVGSIATGYFASSVPFLGALKVPCAILCAVAGVVWALFISIRIYNDIRGKK